MTRSNLVLARLLDYAVSTALHGADVPPRLHGAMKTGVDTFEAWAEGREPRVPLEDALRALRRSAAERMALGIGPVRDAESGVYTALAVASFGEVGNFGTWRHARDCALDALFARRSLPLFRAIATDDRAEFESRLVRMIEASLTYEHGAEGGPS